MNASQLFLSDTAQAVFICFPLICRTFVTADMHILIWERLSHVPKHAFEEVYHFVAPNIEHISGNAAIETYGIGLCRVAAQVGVSGDGSYHVPRQVDFGNDLNVACLGIVHDLA